MNKGSSLRDKFFKNVNGYEGDIRQRMVSEPKAKEAAGTHFLDNHQVVKYEQMVLSALANQRHLEPIQNRITMQNFLKTLIQQQNLDIPDPIKAQLIQNILNDMYAYGPIQPLMDDQEVSDIQIRGPLHIQYMKNGDRFVYQGQGFRDKEHLDEWIDRKVTATGRRFDPQTIKVDTLLADGSRFHAITGVSGINELQADQKLVVRPATIVTIRKFLGYFSPEELVQKRLMPRLAMELIRLIVQLKKSILISGGMGSGKTTTANAICSFLSLAEVLGILEEAPELQPQHENCIRLWEKQANVEGKGAFHMYQLAKESLRMFLDWIAIGEIRDKIAWDYLQMSNSGHPGFTTIHAYNAQVALSRLSSYALSADDKPPYALVQEFVKNGIGIVLQQNRYKNRRICTSISEVVGTKENGYEIHDIMNFKITGKDQKGNIQGHWVWNGVSSHLLNQFKEMLLDVPEEFMNLKNPILLTS